ALEGADGLSAGLGRDGERRLAQPLRYGRRDAARAREPAVGGDLRDAGLELGERQLAVAARSEDRAQYRLTFPRKQRRRAEQDRVAERTRQAEFVAVGQRVAADVDEDQEVAAERAGRGGEAVSDGG